MLYWILLGTSNLNLHPKKKNLRPGVNLNWMRKLRRKFDIRDTLIDGMRCNDM